MTSDLYFTQNKLYKRTSGVDTELESITKGDFISTSNQKRLLDLTAAVDVVISNTVGNYLIICDSQNADPDLAHYTLSIDTDQMDFSQYMQAVVSGTAISIQSDISAQIEVTLIKIS